MTGASNIHMLGIADVCELLNVSRNTFWRLRKHHGFPDGVNLGGCKRWRERDVLAWIDDQPSI